MVIDKVEWRLEEVRASQGQDRLIIRQTNKKIIRFSRLLQTVQCNYAKKEVHAWMRLNRKSNEKGCNCDHVILIAFDW